MECSPPQSDGCYIILFGGNSKALLGEVLGGAGVIGHGSDAGGKALAASRDVYVVELDDEHIDKLIADSPYYSKYSGRQRT